MLALVLALAAVAHRPHKHHQVSEPATKDIPEASEVLEDVEDGGGVETRHPDPIVKAAEDHDDADTEDPDDAHFEGDVRASDRKAMEKEIAKQEKDIENSKSAADLDSDSFDDDSSPGKSKDPDNPDNDPDIAEIEKADIDDGTNKEENERDEKAIAAALQPWDNARAELQKDVEDDEKAEKQFEKEEDQVRDRNTREDEHRLTKEEEVEDYMDKFEADVEKRNKQRQMRKEKDDEDDEKAKAAKDDKMEGSDFDEKSLEKAGLDDVAAKDD